MKTLKLKYFSKNQKRYNFNMKYFSSKLTLANKRYLIK